MRPPRVLLIDDEEEFTSTLSKVLRRRHMEVNVASDGPSALLILAAERFDVVLLDVKMPGMDGIQVLQEIKKRDPALPVILMTGHLAAAREHGDLNEQAFAFVLKPHPVPDLVALVQRAARQGRSGSGR
jgi:DNA-binding NtrC family response regulator